MYSTYNEGKSVVAERSIRTLKNIIFKHMTAISKNVYFDMSDDIVNKYNSIFIIGKIKNTVPWTYVISDLNDEPIHGSFYEKELQTRREKLKIEKVIKKGDKLYVKWKGYDSRLIVGLIKKTLYKNESQLS